MLYKFIDELLIVLIACTVTTVSDSNSEIYVTQIIIQSNPIQSKFICQHNIQKIANEEQNVN